MDLAGVTSDRALPGKIGRYRILCELGQGAMAILYLGRAVGPGSFERLFAIKMIHEHLCRESAFVQMFLNEARLSARIHHPNVISVYEVDVDSGRYYLAMDYMSGENLALTLKHTWNRGRPFPIDTAAHIIAQACEGLHAAHELKDMQGSSLGVVHRDVAPQNVMLGYDGTVRVMDFGIAKAVDQVSQTRPGTMKGTVAYMAPEQIRAESLDRRVDVFALGVVLWETTVGKRLFKSSNDINTAARVLRMTVPKPSTLRDGYPAELERIISKALSRDPDQRYQTARALGQDLQDFLLAHAMRVTPGDLEHFMKDVFGPMYEQRAEMERKASAPVAPERVQSLPRPEEDLSLSALEIPTEIDELVLEVLHSSDDFKKSIAPAKIQPLKQATAKTPIVKTLHAIAPPMNGSASAATTPKASPTAETTARVPDDGKTVIAPPPENALEEEPRDKPAAGGEDATQEEVRPLKSLGGRPGGGEKTSDAKTVRLSSGSIRGSPESESAFSRRAVPTFVIRDGRRGLGRTPTPDVSVETPKTSADEGAGIVVMPAEEAPEGDPPRAMLARREPAAESSPPSASNVIRAEGAFASDALRERTEPGAPPPESPISSAPEPLGARVDRPSSGEEERAPNPIRPEDLLTSSGDLVRSVVPDAGFDEGGGTLVRETSTARRELTSRIVQSWVWKKDEETDEDVLEVKRMKRRASWIAVGLGAAVLAIALVAVRRSVSTKAVQSPEAAPTASAPDPAPERRPPLTEGEKALAAEAAGKVSGTAQETRPAAATAPAIESAPGLPPATEAKPAPKEAPAPSEVAKSAPLGPAEAAAAPEKPSRNATRERDVIDGAPGSIESTSPGTKPAAGPRDAKSVGPSERSSARAAAKPKEIDSKPKEPARRHKAKTKRPKNRPRSDERLLFGGEDL